MRRKKPYKIGSTSVAWAELEIWFDPGLLERDGCDGYFDPKTNRVYVGTQSVHDGAEDTIIHECIHAISRIYCLNLKEKQVRLLATGIVQAWRNLKFTGRKKR